jgi:hypothetical protein
MEKLTGNKQTDLLILSKLTDYELTRVCQVNKYVNGLCDDDNFWLNRIMANYLTLEQIKKMLPALEFSSYKELYIWLNQKFSWYKKHDPLNLKSRLDFLLNNIVTNNKSINKIIPIVDKRRFPAWINRKEFLLHLKRELYLQSYNKDSFSSIIQFIMQNSFPIVFTPLEKNSIFPNK